MGQTMQIPEPGLYRELPSESQAGIQTWLGNLQEQHEDDSTLRTDRAVGLWVWGDRRSGTTYTASAAVKRAVGKNREQYGTIEWEYLLFTEATELVREGWDETSRSHPNDEAAWVDAMRVENLSDHLWKVTDLLWLDDVHLVAGDAGGPISMGFFVKHIFPKMEHRVKMGKALVVSTSVAPTRMGPLARVVSDLFVEVHAVR